MRKGNMWSTLALIELSSDEWLCVAGEEREYQVCRRREGESFSSPERDQLPVKI
ncbi:hypothetical protein RHMOL_Rhmol10G0035800 [Rhododendron molle]|uniref:Uncharacterized protein n=1 Tax=Rhododendron molle TaxID=49168 RepID=A0ACC0LZR7_RHOML|nr:hypothetical protein RHMOL_Rhmol10G0035800 [Rhododendron molle]